MANKMLIDASHPEETRVVVVRGSKVEEFDFESASRKQLRGNIYLAKVTRVEPSLQAAFVEYGGNRQGFLAFNEIHPDYYQIPVADREALLEEYNQIENGTEADNGRRNRRKKGASKKASISTAIISEVVQADHEQQVSENGYEISDLEPPQDSKDKVFKGIPGTLDDAEPIDIVLTSDGEGEESLIEQVGGSGDVLDDIPERPRPQRRQYKIQEVIKRRQLLLVQVVKEERGNKGAALTTYLSLAGRYSVLMPNTGRGGGISRKITNAQDRKRLKDIAQDLEVPSGMGVILRTAGASRTKTEIKRDFEYLMRLWIRVRELTMESSAPLLVYEEGSLIKRAIRDLYNKDIGEVLVSGDEAYREAKDFMRMLMPSHARAVQPYKEPTPIFAHYNVESQLDAMFSNQVQLKSGGYLVINPTEALVSIDVNSGRSTKEHNIEDTAIRTNLEAAEEVARQLRLRDLAGLVVIDFIDMEEKRNNRAVEKRLAECLKSDRARIQIGRISPFGLLEMSRQRIRTGVLESSSIPCAHCGGTGFVRSTPSAALHVLRSIEESLISNSTYNLIVQTHMETAFYILNQKRDILQEFERRFNVSIAIIANDHLQTGTYFVIETGDPADKKSAVTSSVQVQGISVDVLNPPVPERPEAVPAAAKQKEIATEEGHDAEHENGNKRHKRRRRGKNNRRNRVVNGEANLSENMPVTESADKVAEIQADTVEISVSSEVLEPAGSSDIILYEVQDISPNDRQEMSTEEAKPKEDKKPSQPKKPAVSKTKRSRVVENVPLDVANPENTDSADLDEKAPAEIPEKPKRKKETGVKGKKKDAEGKDNTVAKTKPKKVTEKSVKSKETEADSAALDIAETAETKTGRGKAKKNPDGEEETKRTKRSSRRKEVEIQESAQEGKEASILDVPVSIALTPQDPSRPKRAGWWSKKKES